MNYFFEKIIKICGDKETIVSERICQSEKEPRGNTYIEKPIAGNSSSWKILSWGKICLCCKF